jgi:hypothetical protein
VTVRSEELRDSVDRRCFAGVRCGLNDSSVSCLEGEICPGTGGNSADVACPLEAMDVIEPSPFSTGVIGSKGRVGRQVPLAPVKTGNRAQARA